MQVFRVADSRLNPVWEGKNGQSWVIQIGTTRYLSENPIYLFRQFFGKMHRLATIHTLQTTDRQRNAHAVACRQVAMYKTHGGQVLHSVADLKRHLQQTKYCNVLHNHIVQGKFTTSRYTQALSAIFCCRLP